MANKFFQFDKNKNKQNNNDKDIYNFERGITSNDHVDNTFVGKKENQSDYSDHIHVNESPSKEVLYDRNNPFVKILLIILGSISILGCIYYVWTYFTTV